MDAIALHDILFAVLTLISMILGRYTQLWLRKKGDTENRNGMLDTIDKLAELAVHEIEEWRKSGKKDIKPEERKDEAVKLLLQLAKETLLKHELREMNLEKKEQLLKAAVEKKAVEKKNGNGHSPS